MDVAITTIARHPLLQLLTAPESDEAPETVIEDEVGQALLERWRRGEPRAFDEIFRTYRGLVYATLYHLLRSDPEIEDVVQNVFFEVHRSLHRFEGRSKLSSWITRVAINVGLRHLRRRKRTLPLDNGDDQVIEVEGEDNPHDDLERSEAERRLQAILEGINPKKRVVFILNDIQGVPQPEIAEIVGANIATVRTRLFHARKEFWRKVRKDPFFQDVMGDREEGSGED